MGIDSNHKENSDASKRLEQMEEEIYAQKSKLKEQEEFYNDLFNQLDYDIHKCQIMRDAHGEIVSWVIVDINESNLQSWNKTRDEIIGKTPNEVFGYDAIAQFIPIVKEIFETGQPKEWVEYFEPIEQYLKMKTIPYGDCFVSVGRNVTKEKLAEVEVKQLKDSIGDSLKDQDKEEILRALYESKNQFNNLADNLPGVVLKYKLHPDGSDELLYVSKGASDLVEENLEDILDDINLIWAKIHPDDVKLMVPSIRESAKNLSLWEFEYRLVFPGNRIKWVQLRGVPNKEADGSVVWDTIGLDVTKIKEAETALEEINYNLSYLVEERAREAVQTAKDLELYQLAATHSKSGVWYLDLVKNELKWDDIMYELYGANKNDFSGAYEAWEQSLHPDDKAYAVAKFNEAVNENKILDTRFRIIQPNTGNVVHIKVMGKVDFDEDGNAIAIYGTNWDITKEMELVEEKQAIIDQIEIYRLAANSAKAGVWYFDTTKGGSHWDNALFEMYEIDKEEYPDNLLPVETWLQWIYPEDKEATLQTLNDALVYKKSFNIYFRILTAKTKTLKHVKATGKVRLNERGDVAAVYGFNWDISTEMRLVDQLNETIQNLKNTELELINSEKMASLGVLTAGVAHEINNPLNYILGGAAAIEKHMIHSDLVSKDKVAEYLEWITTGANKATKIVKSLNKFSSKSAHHDEVCDLHQIIEDCLLFVQNRVQDRIEITKNYCKKDLVILGNDAELRQAILNIIVNAIDAIDGKGMITVDTLDSADYVEVKVMDNGCGIPKEIINKITDPFFTTKPAGVAVGLGLSITQTTIKEHNGTIRFNTQEGKGTTVCLRFKKNKASKKLS